MYLIQHYFVKVDRAKSLHSCAKLYLFPFLMFKWQAKSSPAWHLKIRRTQGVESQG